MKNRELRVKILKCLGEAKSDLWVREISRRTNIPASTVSLILDEFFSSGIIKDNDLARFTMGK